MKLADLQKKIRMLPDLEDMADQRRRSEYLLALGLEPGALYQELEMSCRYVDTHRDVSFADARVDLHSHSFFELIYCANACGAEYLVGAERYRLQKGDIIFVPPGVSHRPLLPEQMAEPYMRYVLWLSPEFMEKYAGLFPYPFTEKQAQASMLRTAGTPWERVGELFLAGVVEAEKQADGWEAAVLGNTMVLLTQIKRATDARSTQPLEAEEPELPDRVIGYVADHLAERITLGRVARYFFTSESTVSQSFRKRMGVSFYRYVTQRRLIAAKSLIERGVPLETVAARTGFSDYSSFYRAFRQAYGISPRQYRSLQDTTKA